MLQYVGYEMSRLVARTRTGSREFHANNISRDTNLTKKLARARVFCNTRQTYVCTCPVLVITCCDERRIDKSGVKYENYNIFMRSRQLELIRIDALVEM